MDWQDEFRDFMTRLTCFPFAPREAIITHFNFFVETGNYLGLEFLLSDLIRILHPMPTACRILSGIYDGVLLEETIAKTAIECLNFIENGGSDG